MISSNAIKSSKLDTTQYEPVKALLYWLFTLFLLLLTIQVSDAKALSTLQAAELPENLVDHDWLLQHRADPRLVIVDTRSSKEYQQGHVQGAVSVPVWDTFGEDPRSDLAAPMSVIQKLFSKAGIDQKTRVVLYDGGEMINAARVFWILESHGHQHVAILKSGFNQWQAEDYPVSSEIVTPSPKKFISHMSPNRFATKFGTRLALNNPDVIILDSRTSDEYQGKKSKTAKNGHIPGAISFPSGINVHDGDGGLRDIEELKEVYSSLDKNKKVIAYCNKGRESALTYFVLRQLGYDVSAYDGSWFEWSNDNMLPIEDGSIINKL